MWRFKKWQKVWWYDSKLNTAYRSSKTCSISCAFMLDGGRGGPTSNSSSMTSSAMERKMSSLTSRSCLTHSRRSSSRLGWRLAVDMVGDEGMGIVHSPLQYLQVPFVSSANLILRRHLEKSGPVDCAWSIGTPGRRGDVNGSMMSGAEVCESSCDRTARHSNQVVYHQSFIKKRTCTVPTPFSRHRTAPCDYMSDQHRARRSFRLRECRATRPGKTHPLLYVIQLAHQGSCPPTTQQGGIWVHRC